MKRRLEYLMQDSRAVAALALCCVMGAWLSPRPANADSQAGETAPVTFAAYGDMPYSKLEEQVLEQDIAPRIRNGADIPFVIHVGDVGRPEYDCNDEWLEKTRRFFEHDLVKPVFYTPGDNEWTDCDREEAGHKSELGRLEAIRRIFFSEAKTLDAAWHYEQQSALPENQTWQYKGVRFVTQHIVGTKNGRVDIHADDPRLVLEQADQRDRHNREWLDHAFDLAKDKDTQAVVVTMQADPFGKPDGVRDAFARCTGSPIYGEFCTHLLSLAVALGKPVLLIHGDTKPYCLDQPFGTGNASLLWRLNTPGDFYPVIDAALVTFNPGSRERPFSVTGLLSGSPAPSVCD